MTNYKEPQHNNKEIQGTEEQTHDPSDSSSNGVVLHHQETFSGPLPPPAALIQYNEAHPDAAERIIAMAEKQQEHRHKQESRVIAGDSFRASLGLSLGAIIAAGALWMAFHLILNDKTVEGLATVVVALGGPVGAFIYAHKQKTRELKVRDSATPHTTT